jgi:hypothetical protein
MKGTPAPNPAAGNARIAPRLAVRGHAAGGPEPVLAAMIFLINASGLACLRHAKPEGKKRLGGLAFTPGGGLGGLARGVLSCRPFGAPEKRASPL